MPESHSEVNGDVSVLVSSFDAYHDIWPLSKFFFDKYWPACPYPVYLGANGEWLAEKAPPSWFYLNMGKDLSWALSQRQYLEALPTPYVLFLLDDILVNGNPDQLLIEEAAALLRTGAVYVRLDDRETPKKRFNDSFGLLRPHDEYRASLKPALWNKAFLGAMMNYGLSPWEFEEKIGAIRENAKKLFLCSYKNVFPSEHCVRQGQFVYWLPEWLEKEGALALLPRHRSVRGKEEYVSRYHTSKSLKRRLFYSIPPILRYAYRKATGFFDIGRSECIDGDARENG